MEREWRLMRSRWTSVRLSTDVTSAASTSGGRSDAGAGFASVVTQIRNRPIVCWWMYCCTSERWSFVPPSLLTGDAKLKTAKAGFAVLGPTDHPVSARPSSVAAADFPPDAALWEALEIFTGTGLSRAAEAEAASTENSLRRKSPTEKRGPRPGPPSGRLSSG